MSTLEKTLRDLAAAGELTYLSVVPVAGDGPGNIVFSASYSPASRWGHGTGRHVDPVEAIMLAVKAASTRGKRPVKEPEPEISDEDLLA
jgi:hypothetical protein